MRRTLLISALTAVVVMAIAVFAAPRLGTAIAGPDSPESVAASKAATIARAVEKATKVAAFMAAHPRLFNSENATALSVPATEAPEGPSGCCSTWQGFNITGTIVSPARAGVPCSSADPINPCVPGAGAHIAVSWPEGKVFQGGVYDNVVMWHSEIAGPCTVAFVWFSIPFNQIIAGNSRDIDDCGGNTIWTIFFTGNTVPAAPGDTIAVGFIQASNGVTDVDYMQFFIQ